jgi:pyruvate ferredoxin oxidoreductase beta subunit
VNAAVDSCYWPLYEVVDGCCRLTYVLERILPVEDWLRPQKRFAHLLRPDARYVLEEIQRQVDREWAELRRRSHADAAAAAS